MMRSEGDNLKWRVLRYIADSVRCGVCQRSFAPDEVVILSRQEDVWFVSIACDACGTESMILVILQSQSPSSECHHAEEARLCPRDSAERGAGRRLGPITDKEIEELHHFLQGYHGNLTEFWSEGDD